MIAEIQDYILNTIKTLLPSVKIVVGTLPITEGVAIALASGVVDSESIIRTQTRRMTMVVNAKSKTQLTALGWLETIHAKINSMIDFPNEQGYQITRIMTDTQPVFLNQQNNEYYLFGSSIEVRFFSKQAKEA